MKNFVQPGDVIDLVAPAAVLSGAGVLVGSIFGVATADAGSGDEVACNVVGVFELPKVAATAMGQGALAYWDDTGKEITDQSAGNTLVGAVTVAALSADATVKVRLSGAQ